MAFTLSGVGSDRVSLRFALVALLVLALLVPLLLVSGISSERQRYYRSVVAEVAQSYGQAQTLIAPMVVIPVIDQRTDVGTDGLNRVRAVASTHLLLPAQLQVSVAVQHEYRSRGIYSVPVYQAKLSLRGTLPQVDVAAIERQHDQVLWQQAFVSIGLTDTRSVTANTPLQLNGQAHELMPGTGVAWLGNGLRVPLAGLVAGEHEADSPAPYAGAAFSLGFTIGGTSRLAVVPLADQTQIEMTASWPHPKFEGDYLPVEHKISSAGFAARWAVSALARGVPTEFPARDEGRDFITQSAAVTLHEPVTQYTVVDRGLKYGILFVTLTFLAVLCFELGTGARLHLVQYGVVGLALVLFFLLLLSLSEHLSFVWAYRVATLVSVVMLAGYALSVTRSRRAGLSFAAFQVALYGVLYVLLQLEDYALLMGTAVVVVGMLALMFVTRRLHEPPQSAV